MLVVNIIISTLIRNFKECNDQLGKMIHHFIMQMSSQLAPFVYHENTMNEKQQQ